MILSIEIPAVTAETLQRLYPDDLEAAATALTAYLQFEDGDIASALEDAAAPPSFVFQYEIGQLLQSRTSGSAYKVLGYESRAYPDSQEHSYALMQLNTQQHYDFSADYVHRNMVPLDMGNVETYIASLIPRRN